MSTPPSHWQILRLGDVGAICGGSTPSTTQPSNWDGDIPWLIPSDVTRMESLHIASTSRTITQAGLESCAATLLPPGTVMMTSRATIGEAAINAVPMATNQGFINIVCDPSQVINEFLVYWLRRNRAEIESRAYGATFKELSKSNFKAISASLPPLNEQRAIARALRRVQEAIEARRREVALERERMGAIADRLFQVHPSHSLAEASLGDICAISTGTTPSTSRADYYAGTVPFVRTTEINGGRIERTALLISDQAVRDYNLKLYPPGTVLLAMYGQGKTRGHVALLETGATTTQNTAAIVPGHAVNAEYLWHWLRTQYAGLREVGSLGHLSHLNLNYVKCLTILLPKLPEQTAIANVLNACDAKIAALEREIALLDELFRATLEELMTGRLSALPLVDEAAE